MIQVKLKFELKQTIKENIKHFRSQAFTWTHWLYLCIALMIMLYFLEGITFCQTLHMQKSKYNIIFTNSSSKQRIKSKCKCQDNTSQYRKRLDTEFQSYSYSSDSASCILTTESVACVWCHMYNNFDTRTINSACIAVNERDNNGENCKNIVIMEV